MRRRRIRLTNRPQRPVVSDTLPFEVPASFSNRHFCEVLIRYNVRLQNGLIRWECADDTLDVVIRMLTGVPPTEPIQLSTLTQFGRTASVRSLPLLSHSLITMPFGFEICHKAKEARRLTVAHPLNQLAVAEFYHAHAPTITYYSGLSPYSIRRPSAIARYSNYKDRLHEALLARERGQIEERGREYDEIGSYFVYETYSNVFKFFESHQYHRSEKRFNAMAKVDISRCFDSIYTHSLPWAIHGNRAVKDNLIASKSTFSGLFDSLMQNLNQNETNGIVIGPEFSRIFAELILQSVDVQLERRLRNKHNLLHKHDYEIFRYVDDYYIFFNDENHESLIIENLRSLLSDVKLSINPDKTKLYTKPIITEITIAKNAISNLIEDKIKVSEGLADSIQEGGSVDRTACPRYECKTDSRKLIVEYKTVLKSAGVTYLEVGNYTFALLENKVDKMLAAYVKTHRENRGEEALVKGIVDVMEFAFFIYASSPRVNISIRVARIITVVTRSLRRLEVSVEQRHRFFKYVYDNASHQLKKNQVLEYKEIENLYLLVALGEIGKEYWLEETILRQHLHITESASGAYECDRSLSMFSITVLLFYMKDKTKYNKLRNFIAETGVAKIESRVHYKHKDAEALMLALDLLSCPFLSAPYKQRVANVYGFSPIDLANIASVSKNWFTTWGNANVAEELDAKRRREVY